jgi:general secretion pathway protein J
VREVEEFRVAVRPEFQQAWVSGWEQAEPPAVVRFQIQTRGRFWPELIVQVQR